MVWGLGFRLLLRSIRHLNFHQSSNVQYMKVRGARFRGLPMYLNRIYLGL